MFRNYSLEENDRPLSFGVVVTQLLTYFALLLLAVEGDITRLILICLHYY